MLVSLISLISARLSQWAIFLFFATLKANPNCMKLAEVAPLAELTGIQFGVVNEEDIVSFTSMQSFVFLLDLLLLTAALH